MPKPKVQKKCVASKYAGRNERIIEYSLRGVGGLISFIEDDDGRLIVDLYRHSPQVSIRHPEYAALIDAARQVLRSAGYESGDAEPSLNEMNVSRTALNKLRAALLRYPMQEGQQC